MAKAAGVGCTPCPLSRNRIGVVRMDEGAKEEEEEAASRPHLELHCTSAPRARVFFAKREDCKQVTTRAAHVSPANLSVCTLLAQGPSPASGGERDGKSRARARARSVPLSSV